MSEQDINLYCIHGTHIFDECFHCDNKAKLVKAIRDAAEELKNMPHKEFCDALERGE